MVNRKYVIIPTTELGNVNFQEVLQTSAETCRYSVDETKFLVKYFGLQPPSILALVEKSQEYTHEEILSILSTPEWTPENLDLDMVP